MRHSKWFLVGIVPEETLPAIAEASAPYADAMIKAGILGFPLALLAAGIAFGGDFSTLNASIAVPPRYLFTMARDGAMPRIFARVHPRFQTPYISIIVLGVLTVLLITTNSLIYIASLSLFADLFYYVIGIAAAYGLRKKKPDMERPYKTPMIWIGVPVSMVIYLIMMTQLNAEAFWTGVVWCVLGLIIFFICRSKYGNTGDEGLNDLIMAHDDPGPEEKAKMDREYRTWKIIVGIACAAAGLIYIVPLVL